MGLLEEPLNPVKLKCTARYRSEQHISNTPCILQTYSTRLRVYGSRHLLLILSEVFTLLWSQLSHLENRKLAFFPLCKKAVCVFGFLEFQQLWIVSMFLWLTLCSRTHRPQLFFVRCSNPFAVHWCSTKKYTLCIMVEIWWLNDRWKL